MKTFCYNDDTLATRGEGSWQCFSNSKEWMKFRDWLPFLTRKGFPLESKVSLYFACVRNIMFYGSEAYAVKEDDVTRLDIRNLFIKSARKAHKISANSWLTLLKVFGFPPLHHVALPLNIFVKHRSNIFTCLSKFVNCFPCRHWPIDRYSLSIPRENIRFLIFSRGIKMARGSKMGEDWGPNFSRQFAIQRR